jgi:hypothetical protein
MLNFFHKLRRSKSRTSRDSNDGDQRQPTLPVAAPLTHTVHTRRSSEQPATGARTTCVRHRSLRYNTAALNEQRISQLDNWIDFILTEASGLDGRRSMCHLKSWERMRHVFAQLICDKCVFLLFLLAWDNCGRRSQNHQSAMLLWRRYVQNHTCLESAASPKHDNMQTSRLTPKWPAALPSRDDTHCTCGWSAWSHPCLFMILFLLRLRNPPPPHSQSTCTPTGSQVHG